MIVQDRAIDDDVINTVRRRVEPLAPGGQVAADLRCLHGGTDVIAVENREDILIARKNISCVADNNKFYFQLNDGRKFQPTDHSI